MCSCTQISPIAIVLYSVNFLWLVIVSLTFDGNLQIILQRCQIIAPRWPNDISSTIFNNRAQNIDCSFGCMARSAVLLKPNVANILLLNFCEQNFVQHGPITIAIDYNGLSWLIFEEKWPNYASGPKSDFLCLKCDNFACLHTRHDQNELHLKRRFFLPKSASSVSSNTELRHAYWS